MVKKLNQYSRWCLDSFGKSKDIYDTHYIIDLDDDLELINDDRILYSKYLINRSFEENRTIITFLPIKGDIKYLTFNSIIKFDNNILNNFNEVIENFIIIS